MLMVNGVPYDSPEGQAISGAITAIMCGHAYKTSAELAAVKGPFAGYTRNRAPMLNVMNKHRAAAYRIDEKSCPSPLLEAARQDWDEAVALGEQFGYRNSQTTVIAPTGTIGLLMDCDTTGVEPDFAVVKFKKLAGGGSMKIVNQAVNRALVNLGYSPSERKEIIEYAIGSGSLAGNTPINATSLKTKGLTDEDIAKVEKALPTAFDINFVFNTYILGPATLERLGVSVEEEAKPGFSLLKKLGYSVSEIEASNEKICGTQMLEGAPHLKKEHYAVFDCANTCGPKGQRYISPMAHVRMMAAVQPFISGAISKTVNLPNSASVDDIKEVYVESWKLGVKALAVYRDGSKLSQPLNAKRTEDEETAETPAPVAVSAPKRRRLADERQAITHKFQIAGHEGYLTVGLFEDGTPGEIFITMAKQGSVINGLMDAFATSISIALQYGVPLEALVKKFSHSRFEPSGFTSNPQIRIAKSIVDYIGRYLAIKFLSEEALQTIGVHSDSPASSSQTPLNLTVEPVVVKEAPMAETAEAVENLEEQPATDAPLCPNCGSMTFKSGTCYTCLNCGSTTGGCS